MYNLCVKSQIITSCRRQHHSPPPVFREQLCATYRVRTQCERCSKPRREFPINLQSAGTLCPTNKPGRLVGAFLPKRLSVCFVPQPVPEVYPLSHLATGAAAAPAAPERTLITSPCWNIDGNLLLPHGATKCTTLCLVCANRDPSARFRKAVCGPAVVFLRICSNMSAYCLSCFLRQLLQLLK